MSASRSNPIRLADSPALPPMLPHARLPYVRLTDTGVKMKATLTTRRGRLRTLLFFAIGLSAGALATLAYELHLFPRLELTSVDTRFSIRGDTARPSDVVVVGIDDVTFDETGLRWPFARSVQAKVIDRLAAAGAKVIAEDIQYTEPTTPMPGCGRPCEQLAEDEDAALAESVYNAGQRGSKVVLSTTEVEPTGARTSSAATLRVLGARAGNGNYIPDADGVIRRFPYQIAKLETFPVVAAERALGHTLDPSAFPEKRGLDRLRRPGRGGSVPLLLAGADGEVRPRGRAREDGGRRRHGRLAA